MKNSILLFLWLSMTAILRAEPYVFTSLGIEQGLSSNYVVSITQDKDGFLWFATEEGLNKFDGSRFINYYKHTGSLSGNALNCIYADPHEPVIWVATQRAGLNAYNYEQNTLKVFTHSDTSNSLITNDVTSINPAIDGNLWITTYYGGVDYFDKITGEFNHYNMSTVPGMVSNNTWTVLEDGKGLLYIGHAEQGMSVLSLDDGQVRNYRHNPLDAGSIPDDGVRCIYKDNNNNIWVGTRKGLALFNTETGKFIRMTGNNFSNVLSSHILSISQMSDGKLWVTTELNGIAIIDLKQHIFQKDGQMSVQHYTVGHNRYSLTGATVRAAFQDSFQNVWLGTHGGGINFVSHTSPIFDSYDYSPIPDDLNSLNNKFVLGLCIDKDGRLWVGTDGGGVNIFEQGRRVAVLNKENGKLPHDVIQAMCKDARGDIWLGAFLGGLYHYDYAGKRFSRIPLGGDQQQDVRCFFEDEDGHVWVGTHLGVFVLDSETKKEVAYYHTGKGELQENLIHAIGCDERGQMWIGTFGQGLAVYTRDMRLLADFKVDKGFCSNTVNYIFKDSHGQMWVATGDGLVRFANPDTLDQYQIFGREDGLLNTYVSAIAEDKAGNIWFSTNAGISCYLRAQEQFYNYNYFDKTPMGNFSSSVAQDEKGTVYFGANGVRFFDPAAVLRKREVSPIAITEMRFYESESSRDNEHNLKFFNANNRKVQLTYRQNTFSITFNVQNFSLANQVEYAYMLKGLDDSWYTLGENNVTFRNIPPGKYEFRVNARIKNHDWPDGSQVLYVQITPPFWLSWWAKTVYFICLTVILFAGLYAYKKRVDLKSSYEMELRSHEQEQNLNNERLRFYTNITHELRTPLTLILGPLEDLLKDPNLLPKQLKKISVVRQSALRLLNLINQILEFRKMETQNKQLCISKGNIAGLVKEIAIKYKELNTNPNVDFEITVETEEMLLYFDKEIVNTILDNLISNAMKYTRRGTISIALYTVVRGELSYTEMKVADTGTGISQEEQKRIFDRYYQVMNDHQVSGTGIGLALVKNLVMLHEGEIRVESELGKGSSFLFSLLTHNIYTNALHREPEDKKEAAVEEVANAEEQMSNEKPVLLVVEDDVDIREYIHDSFDDSFDVVTASEGEEGCKAAFARIPDIIVSDIMMPGMNGISFCKKVKEDMRTCHIPVILLTAKDSLQDKEEGYMSGADSYLTKPFSATLLRSRINNLLETRKKLTDHLSSHLKLDVKGTLFKESLNQLDNEFLENLTDLVEENLESEKVDITYLSNKLNMSSSTLYRKIKALTGISTNEFIKKIKMRNAEQLLLTGKYNVSEITFKLGMNNPKYFRECFKEEFGMSPSDYLRKISKSGGNGTEI